MAGFGKNLFFKPLTSSFKNVVKRIHDIKALEQCADAINANNYMADYDMNQDGYLTKEDYNLLYDYTYSKYDNYPLPIDMKLILRMKKIINGEMEYDNKYDLANEGSISENSINICIRWLFYGKTEKAFA